MPSDVAQYLISCSIEQPMRDAPQSLTRDGAKRHRAYSRTVFSPTSAVTRVIGVSTRAFHERRALQKAARHSFDVCSRVIHSTPWVGIRSAHPPKAHHNLRERPSS